MRDIEIDELLNKINNSKNYNFKQIRHELPQSKYNEYTNLIAYLKDDLKLVKFGFGTSGNLILTAKGNEVLKQGGWIQYQLKLNTNEKRETKISKWKYYVFWPIFLIALVGAVYNFIDFKKTENIESEIKSLKQKQKVNDSIILLLKQSINDLNEVQEKIDSIDENRQNLK